MKQRVQSDYASSVMSATARSRDSRVTQAAQKPPGVEPRLSPQGELMPEASVRFVAPDGTHRYVPYPALPKHCVSASDEYPTLAGALSLP